MTGVFTDRNCERLGILKRILFTPVTSNPVTNTRVTLQDVADAAGLSKSAASYALRGIKASPVTQQRVQTIADELGYVANPAAQALASGKTNSIAISASLRDVWQQSIAVKLSGALRARGFYATIIDVDADPVVERNWATSTQTYADGLITIPVDPQALWWDECRLPVVAIGDCIPHANRGAAVDFDNELGVSQALNHLAELGHSSVALLTTTLATAAARPIDALAAKYAERYGLTLNTVTVPPFADQAQPVVTSLLEAGFTTALFCLSDSAAFGAYRAARELDIAVPEGISILGYDGSELADLVSPALATFAWDDAGICTTAVELLEELLALPDDEEAGTSLSTIFAPHFTTGGSIGQPHKALAECSPSYHDLQNRSHLL